MTMEVEEQRPVHLVIDCRTRETSSTPLTDAEWEAHQHRIVEAQAERERAAAEDEALRAAVAGHPDPVVQALGRHLGLLRDQAGA